MFIYVATSSQYLYIPLLLLHRKLPRFVQKKYIKFLLQFTRTLHLVVEGEKWKKVEGYEVDRRYRVDKRYEVFQRYGFDKRYGTG